MLTTAEAADYCGFGSAETFKRLARVAPVNYGKSVRYDRQRLDDWLDTLTAAGDVAGHDIVEAAGHEDRTHSRA
jgi:hypothetical protein